MNNLRKFGTEAAYTAATLNYPAVSWVTGTDEVHFDKVAPVVNTKVKIAFTTDSCGGGKTMYICSSSALPSLNSITLNGSPIELNSSSIYLTLTNNTDYLIEYELKDNVTDIQSWFDLGSMYLGCASAEINYDILIPAQVTNIGGVGSAIYNIILEETTPPSIVSAPSGMRGGLYVPDSAVNTYKTAAGWDSMSSYTYPISDYQGKIPV